MLKPLAFAIGAGFVSVVTVTFVAAQFLPGQLDVSQELEMAAPADMIFPYVGKPRLWPRWSSWHQAHDTAPDWKETYGGPAVGVGMWVAWASETSGQRKIKIATYEPFQRMAYEMTIGDSSRSWQGRFNLTTAKQGEENALTRVLWRLQTDLGWNPVARIMGYFSTDALSEEMKTSLSNLQAQVEPEWAMIVDARQKSRALYGQNPTEAVEAQ